MQRVSIPELIYIFMQLPFFFEEILPGNSVLIMSEESSRHMVQVLRMKEGNKIQITDGKGHLFTGEITSAHKKKTEVTIEKKEFFPSKNPKIAIAVSLLKNTGRFEWFLEKATEIGVGEIIPLLCKRTEKNYFREDRMKTILISALLQSRQVWLPELRTPEKYPEVINNISGFDIRLIAHCLEDGQKRTLQEFSVNHNSSKIIFIGPEGDFTPGEIEQALSENFVPVSLGENRLRTETAAIVAAVKLCIS